MGIFSVSETVTRDVGGGKQLHGVSVSIWCLRVSICVNKCVLQKMEKFSAGFLVGTSMYSIYKATFHVSKINA